VKFTRFQDIPKVTRSAGYAIDISLRSLPHTLVHYVENYSLQMSPDFQRGYVWTLEQKQRYTTHLLRCGAAGRDIYFNCVGWNGLKELGEFVLVDGKQRLDALIGFLSNDFPVFGSYYREFTDRLPLGEAGLRFHINDLATRAECLQWYLDLNTGGTVHSATELDMVAELMRGGVHEVPSKEEIVAQARLGRPAMQAAIAQDEALWEEMRRGIPAATMVTKKGARGGRKGK
jgi:hypothetical protein